MVLKSTKAFGATNEFSNHTVGLELFQVHTKNAPFTTCFMMMCQKRSGSLHTRAVNLEVVPTFFIR